MSVFFLGLPVLLGLFILPIALLIFLIVRFGKDRPWVVIVFVAGLALLILAGMSFFVAIPHDVKAPAAYMGVRPTPRVAWVSIILPFVLLTVLVGIIVAFVKGGKPVRITIGVLFGLALLLLPLAGLFGVRLKVAREHQRATAVVRAAGSDAVWHEALADQYPADVYPSRRSAARALGIRLAAALDEALPGRRQDTRIGFVKDPANPGLVEILAEGYGTRGGTMTLSPSPDEPVTVSLKLIDVQTGPAPWSVGSEQAESGTLQAVAQIKNGTSTTVTADFIAKPWVENISAFVSRDPLRQFALARSHGSFTTPEEARAQAVDNARSIVSEFIRRTLPGQVPPVHEADLESHGLIADRFSQRLSGGMAGPVFREAILVDISGHKLQTLVANRKNIHRQERVTWARHALTLAGMLGLITAVYVFLNAATRGYYTAALRTAALFAVAAGVLFLLLMA